MNMLDDLIKYDGVENGDNSEEKNKENKMDKKKKDKNESLNINQLKGLNDVITMNGKDNNYYTDNIDNNNNKSKKNSKIISKNNSNKSNRLSNTSKNNYKTNSNNSVKQSNTNISKNNSKRPSNINNSNNNSKRPSTINKPNNNSKRPSTFNKPNNNSKRPSTKNKSNNNSKNGSNKEIIINLNENNNETKDKDINEIKDSDINNENSIYKPNVIPNFDNNNEIPNIINNNQNIENNNENTNKDLTQQKAEEKDIIEQLIERVKTNQHLTNREKSKDVLNRLDEEIRISLEKLSEIPPELKSYLDSPDKNMSKNKKFMNFLSEVNKAIIQSRNKEFYDGTSFLYLKDKKIIKPRIYFQSEKKPVIREKNINMKYINPFHFSAIDGKLVKDRERNNLFSNDDCEDITNNNINESKNMESTLYTSDIGNPNHTFYLNKKLSFSFDNKRNNENSSTYRLNRVGRFDKDYFNEELRKVHNLLFTKRNFSLNNKFY